jgi:MFS family permease
MEVVASSTTNSSGQGIPKQRWLRVIVPIMIACIMSYMDRVNIGFAMPGGMNADLGINAGMAGMAGGIFFIGYLFLQIPGGNIAAHGSGKKFIAWSLVAWAVISVLTGLVHTAGQLLTLRFALGVAEGGMLPVVLTMISNWFPDHERGRANAMVIMFVPIAGIITAPLSGMIIAMLDWRYLFIIEGLLSVVALVMWVMTMSDRPKDAKWLSEAERNYILSELAAEEARVSQNVTASKAKLSELLGSKAMILLIVFNFFYQTGIYGYTLWLPTILKTLTHSGMGMVGLLSILPYVGTIVGMLSISVLSDRSGKRKKFIVLPLFGFALCMFLSVFLRSNMYASYAALVGGGVFLQAAAGVFWTIPPKLFSASVAGGARGLINALGNLGGFCGPYFVGVLITHYDQSVAVYALAGALAIAGLVGMLIPNTCNQK